MRTIDSDQQQAAPVPRVTLSLPVDLPPMPDTLRIPAIRAGRMAMAMAMGEHMTIHVSHLDAAAVEAIGQAWLKAWRAHCQWHRDAPAAETPSTHPSA